MEISEEWYDEVGIKMGDVRQASLMVDDAIVRISGGCLEDVEISYQERRPFRVILRRGGCAEHHLSEILEVCMSIPDETPVVMLLQDGTDVRGVAATGRVTLDTHGEAFIMFEEVEG